MLLTLEGLQDRLCDRSRGMQGPWGALLRMLRYPVALLRDWLDGEIAVQATSLAYTTLLSLVPLMVFSFAILKGLGARLDLEYILHEFFRPVGGAARQLTETVLTFVANMQGGLLGALGLAFLLYTVISTIQKVEASFNFLWRIERPRSLARRFVEYLGMMIVAPVLIGVALELLGTAARSALAQHIDSIAELGWLLRTAGALMPYAIVTAVFTVMYVFLPNTHVEARPALIGGVSAGVVWALVGKVFAAFIVASSGMMAVYTGFAIVLTTLIWVYLSWLILLIGGQLAFYVQFPEYLRHGRDPLSLTGGAWERAGVSILYLLGRARDSGAHGAGARGWTASLLAQELDLPGGALRPVLACLEQAGLIERTGAGVLRLCRDPAAIDLAALIDTLRTERRGGAALGGRPPAPVEALAEEAEAAVRRTLEHRTLADLIETGSIRRSG